MTSNLIRRRRCCQSVERNCQCKFAELQLESLLSNELFNTLDYTQQHTTFPAPCHSGQSGESVSMHFVYFHKKVQNKGWWSTLGICPSARAIQLQGHSGLFDMNVTLTPRHGSGLLALWMSSVFYECYLHRTTYNVSCQLVYNSRSHRDVRWLKAAKPSTFNDYYFKN